MENKNHNYKKKTRLHTINEFFSVLSVDIEHQSKHISRALIFHFFKKCKEHRLINVTVHNLNDIYLFNNKSCALH